MQVQLNPRLKLCILPATSCVKRTIPPNTFQTFRIPFKPKSLKKTVAKILAAPPSLTEDKKKGADRPTEKEHKSVTCRHSSKAIFGAA